MSNRRSIDRLRERLTGLEQAQSALAAPPRWGMFFTGGRGGGVDQSGAIAHLRSRSKDLRRVSVAQGAAARPARHYSPESEADLRAAFGTEGETAAQEIDPYRWPSGWVEWSIEGRPGEPSMVFLWRYGPLQSGPADGETLAAGRAESSVLTGRDQ